VTPIIMEIAPSTAEKSIPSDPRHAAVSEKTLPEAVVACFQDH
jgi:hypothetical protein